MNSSDIVPIEDIVKKYFPETRGEETFEEERQKYSELRPHLYSGMDGFYKEGMIEEGREKLEELQQLDEYYDTHEQILGVGLAKVDLEKLEVVDVRR